MRGLKYYNSAQKRLIICVYNSVETPKNSPKQGAGPIVAAVLIKKPAKTSKNAVIYPVFASPVVCLAYTVNSISRPKRRNRGQIITSVPVFFSSTNI